MKMVIKLKPKFPIELLYLYITFKTINSAIHNVIIQEYQLIIYLSFKNNKLQLRLDWIFYSYLKQGTG